MSAANSPAVWAEMVYSGPRGRLRTIAAQLLWRDRKKLLSIGVAIPHWVERRMSRRSPRKAGTR